MNFNEVILSLTNFPGSSFTALSLSMDRYFLSVYVVSTCEDDPNDIVIAYEGGEFFSPDGEEDNFQFDSAPDEVFKLNFVESKSLPDLSGYVAEYVAFKLFPELPDPEQIYSQRERERFVRVASKLIEEKFFPGQQTRTCHSSTSGK